MAGARSGDCGKSFLRCAGCHRRKMSFSNLDAHHAILQERIDILIIVNAHPRLHRRYFEDARKSDVRKRSVHLRGGES